MAGASMACLLAGLLLSTGIAAAAPPSAPTFDEPPATGVNAGDVHMVAGGFSDPDGGTLQCTDWEIWTVATAPELVWTEPCAAGGLAVHTHLGDGTFVGSLAGQDELAFGADYRLKARFHDSGAEIGPYAERGFHTDPLPPPGAAGSLPWLARQPNFAVDEIAGGFQLPVAIAMVPNPGGASGDPSLYVAELYGKIKVVANDGTVSDYATGILNFNPTGHFPGSGEQGIGGIAVDPLSGDVFASTMYEDTASPLDLKPRYGKVVRFHSTDGGRTAAAQTTILDLAGTESGASHQISNVTISPGHELFVHVGDGVTPIPGAVTQNPNSYLGKVLRMNLNGVPLPDSPFYNGPPITARDYVYAMGFRNPFGGVWRLADGSHYEVENGPNVDRLAKVMPGFNYGYDGTDASMATGALYNWPAPAHAPIAMAFTEPALYGGSGFPPAKMGHAYVTESGPTYATGPQPRGKRIVEFAPGPGGEPAGPPSTLVEYGGVGKATAAAMAAGPRGLYFTELYKDVGAASAIDPGARLLLVRYAPPTSNTRLLGRTLTVDVGGRGPRAERTHQTARISRGEGGSIDVNGSPSGVSVEQIDRIAVEGGPGREDVTLALGDGGFAPGAEAEQDRPEIEISVDLRRGRDSLRVQGGPGSDALGLRGASVSLNGDGDADLQRTGIERVTLAGGGGVDLLQGDRAANLLKGGPGADILEGGAGADRLIGGSGSDECDGGAGRDLRRGCESGLP